jgi:hypothetical protein
MTQHHGTIVTSSLKKLASLLLDRVTPDMSGCLSDLTEAEVLKDLHYGRDELVYRLGHTSNPSSSLASEDLRGAA